MAVFVPNCEHDIFVSYAHVDDLVPPGAEEGWVTTMVKVLQTFLAQKLGRSDAYSLWMDPQLSRHISFTPQLIDSLHNAATLLVILSPGYLASDWCKRESNVFFQQVAERARSASRVFVVERDKVEDEDRPPQFAGLLGYRFWVQDREGRPPRILGVPRPKDDTRYYDVLNDLSSDLAKELRRLKAAAGVEAVSPKWHTTVVNAQASHTQATVFLAEVTDDLEPLRDEVKRYLDQAGLRVLPETWYSREPSDFQRAVDEDLAQSQLFVQLLSGVVGRRPPNLPQGYARLQYERALAVDLPVLHWRSPELDVNAVNHENHRAFLELDTVFAVGIEEFKREIGQRATYKPPPKRQAAFHALVFVNVEKEDRPLANEVCEVLRKKGVDLALPMLSQSHPPSEIRDDLEQNLLYCDALLFIYGCTSVRWVRSQLLSCRRFLSKREDPLQVIALYQGPPEEKAPVDIMLGDMRTIDCRFGLDEAKLQEFIESLG